MKKGSLVLIVKIFYPLDQIYIVENDSEPIRCFWISLCYSISLVGILAFASNAKISPYGKSEKMVTVVSPLDLNLTKHVYVN